VPALLALHIAFNSSLALIFTPTFATGLNQLPRALHAHGSAIASTLQQVAGAMGTALLVTIMTTSSAARLQANPATSQVEALGAGLQSAFVAATGIAVLGLLLALFVRRSSPPEEEPGAPAMEPALAH
jgi:DHA2 family lincomycin resistance protein-like MFS transporter